MTLDTKPKAKEYRIYLQNQSNSLDSLVVTIPLRLKYYYRGAPGVLSFRVREDRKTVIEEGDTVYLYYKNVVVFKGYVFTIRYTNNREREITCYDQIRYLKNKDTYVYTNKRTSDLLRDIADLYQLRCGIVENTLFYLQDRIERNKTLLDILQTSLDETLLETGRYYILFDDCGGLSIRHIQNMKIATTITNENCTSIEYQSTIDNEVYNQIKLACYSEEPKENENVYMLKSSTSIKNWGILQYFEEIESQEDASKRSQLLLEYYNKKKIELSLTTTIGNITIRGGSIIPIDIAIGDKSIQQYAMVQEVEHIIGKEHTMKLILRGIDL